ncbi:MAG: hypothetical protein K9M57_02300 [Phycisphaerae bacterium]|nr:hypothetical protein [Phycisphaerae bacterium]
MASDHDLVDSSVGNVGAAHGDYRKQALPALLKKIRKVILARWQKNNGKNRVG